MTRGLAIYKYFRGVNKGDSFLISLIRSLLQQLFQAAEAAVRYIKDALTYAEQDIKDRWVWYKERFKKGMKQ